MMSSTAAANIRRRHSQAPPEQQLLQYPRKWSSIYVRDPVAEKKFETVILVLKKDSEARGRFLVAFRKWEKERSQTLNNLEIILYKLQKIQNRSSTASLIGKSVGATGGVAAIVGTVLLPVTLGLSSAVVAGGAIIGLSASASTLGAKAMEYTAVCRLLDEMNFHLRWDYLYFSSLLSWLSDARDEKGTKLGELIDWLHRTICRTCEITSSSYDEYLSFLVSQLNLGKKNSADWGTSESLPSKPKEISPVEIWLKAEPTVQEKKVKQENCKTSAVLDMKLNVASTMDIRNKMLKRRSKSLLVSKHYTDQDILRYMEKLSITEHDVDVDINFGKNEELSESVLDASPTSRVKWRRNTRHRSKSCCTVECHSSVLSIEDARNSREEEDKASLILEDNLEMSNAESKFDYLTYGNELRRLSEVFAECAQKYKTSQKLSNSMMSIPRSKKQNSHFDKKATSTLITCVKELYEAFAADKAIYEILYIYLDQISCR